MKKIFLAATLWVLGFAHSEPRICEALFSQRQVFWPELDRGAKSDSIRVAVLPVYAERYSESKECDSCHRLSENGMEFFLGNALRRILDTALQRNHPRAPEVELIAPQWPLLLTRHVEFPRDVDSLQLPWDKWLPDCQDPLIFRPHETYARSIDRQRLAKVGGAVGFTHLFVVRNFRVAVKPISRSDHLGGLHWEWRGALYNVREGRFEWALEFSDDRDSMDLDADLEPGLAKALGTLFRGLPKALKELRESEPR